MKDGRTLAMFRMKLKKMLTAVTYERQMFIKLMVLVAVPVIIMGIITYNIYLKEESARSNMELESYGDKVSQEYEDLFSSVKMYYLQLASEDDVRWMVWQNTPPYDQYSRIKRIQQDMQANYFKSQYIDAYDFIDVQENWVMNKYGMYTFDAISNQDATQNFIDAQKEIPLNAYWIYNSASQGKVYATNYKMVGTDGLRLIIKNNIGRGNIAWMISVSMNMPMLNSAAESYQKLGYSVTILDKDDVLEQNNTAMTQAYLSASDGMTKGTTRVRGSDGFSYQLTVRSGGTSGFTYLIGYNESKVRMDGLVFLRTAIFVIIGIGILLFAVYMVSIAFAAPLHYLEASINEGEKRIQELLLVNMLKGELDTEKIDSGLEKTQVTPFESYRALSLVCKEEKQQPEEQVVLYEEIRKKLSENITALVFIMPLIYKNMLVFIIGGNNDREAENKTALLYTLLRDFIQANFERPIAVGISQPFHNLKHTNRAYNECREALYDETNRKNPGNSTLVLYDDYSMAHQDRNVYDKIMEESMIKAIEHQDREESRRLLEELIQRMYVQRGNGIERDYYLTKLLTTLLHIPVEHGIALSEIFNDENYDVMNHILQIYDTRVLIDEISQKVIEPMILQLQRKDGLSNNPELIQEIKRMIKESKGNITLNECAIKLNYHPNYLSKILKKDRGVTFTDMVNEEKLMQIKYLLLTTDTSVAEIAEILKYNNVQNMIRFFKKNTEQTPAVFRKEHRTTK